MALSNSARDLVDKLYEDDKTLSPADIKARVSEEYPGIECRLVGNRITYLQFRDKKISVEQKDVDVKVKEGEGVKEEEYEVEIECYEIVNEILLSQLTDVVKVNMLKAFFGLTA